jgi:hypothetical protein
MAMSVLLACDKEEEDRAEQTCQAYCDISVGCAAEVGSIPPDEVDFEMQYCLGECKASLTVGEDGRGQACVDAELAMLECLNEFTDCEEALGAEICTVEIEIRNDTCGYDSEPDTG